MKKFPFFSFALTGIVLLASCSKESDEDGLMDFGDGACDGTATLTIGGEVYTIDL